MLLRGVGDIKFPDSFPRLRKELFVVVVKQKAYTCELDMWRGAGKQSPALSQVALKQFLTELKYLRCP